MIDPRGYYQKFQVKYASGQPLPESAVTFVLILNEDEHARRAALAYAASVEAENPTLAHDLRALVEKFS